MLPGDRARPFRCTRTSSLSTGNSSTMLYIPLFVRSPSPGKANPRCVKRNHNNHDTTTTTTTTTTNNTTTNDNDNDDDNDNNNNNDDNVSWPPGLAARIRVSSMMSRRDFPTRRPQPRTAVFLHKIRVASNRESGTILN